MKTSTGSRWLLPILLANLIAEIGIIVTGGLVRLTGSGLGCPTWPQCVPGSYTPVAHQPQGAHKYIEFANRTLTGVLLVLAIAALVAVLVWAHRRDLRIAAWAVLGGVLAQAILGGITVRTQLSPLTVSAHFALSALLVLASSYLWLAARRQPAAWQVPALVRWAALATCGWGAIVIVLGTIVTGSGPHSGDANAPARYGLDPRSMSWLHADAVMLFVGMVLALVLASQLVGTTRAARAWLLVLLVTLLQGALGYTQYLTGLPVVMVALHMLGSAILVLVLVRAVLALRDEAPRTPAAGRSS